MSSPYDLSSGDKGFPALRRAERAFYQRVAQQMHSSWPPLRRLYDTPRVVKPEETPSSLEEEVEVVKAVLQQDLKRSSDTK